MSCTGEASVHVSLKPREGRLTLSAGQKADPTRFVLEFPQVLRVYCKENEHGKEFSKEEKAKMVRRNKGDESLYVNQYLYLKIK